MAIRIINEILSIIYTIILRVTSRVSIGEKSQVFFRSEIINDRGNTVMIGNNCKIGRSRHRYHGRMPFYTTLLSDGRGSQIIIGDNCRINGAYIHAKDKIVIGDNCVIASGVNIIDIIK